ncbi:MAG TPA: amidohydrolase family protein [Mycobacteriales bacterium]|nr:amidohydrolase family protein [Mycobacteriales bacterium]
MNEAPFHFSGVLLPDDVSVTIGVVGGRITYDEPSGSTLVADNVWIVPGFVDAHCHVGLGKEGAVGPEVQRIQAEDSRDGGTHVARDCGVPAETRWIDDEPDLPQIIRAGRHVARPKRYIRDVGVDVEPEGLVAAVEVEAKRGDGWVKLVGDWIDRDRGDLAPLWPRDVAEAAISRAHELGARVTAHVFGEEAPHDLVAAGIDCLEHGTGITADLLGVMAERQVALVPTLVNIENFPGIADSAGRFPAYADHMRVLHRTAGERLRAAYEAGVPIYAGTDAGSMIEHGRIADEIRALHAAGMSAKDALAAASWQARKWLGVGSGVAEGDIASFNVYAQDPYDMTAFAAPSFIVLKGRVRR